MTPKKQGRSKLHHWWSLLFILPVVGSLDVPLYARQSPAISGIPFFIWFQFVLVIVGALVTGVVNHLQHRHGEQEEAEAVNP